MAETPLEASDEARLIDEMRLIGRLCDRFDEAWQVGRRPAIELFLADAPPSAREVCLCALIARDIEHRRLRGENPTPDEYENRFDNSSDLVASVFRQSGFCSQARVSTPEPEGESDPDLTVELKQKEIWPAPSLPGYEILGQLGAGGMGIVYKARQLSLNRLVALKLIRPDGLVGPPEKARFRREAEAAARLRHLNVVQVYESGEHNGQPYAVLEYIEGSTLAKQIANAPPALRDAAALVEKLARAAQHAHDNGILHRDLKPGNVLMAADGTPKIADFGLARWLGSPNEQTADGEVLGTPSYMAPEQASGQLGKLGPATDVYALGVILYQLLTGQVPFRGRTLLETLEQVKSQGPIAPRQLRNEVPRDLDSICLKCLAKEPCERYASAAALADDLKRWLDGLPTVARPEGWPRKARRLMLRHWGKFALALTGALAGCAALAYATFLYRSSPEELEFKRQQIALLALQRDLASGGSVELIGKTGAPRYFRWQTAAPRQQVFVRDDGTFTAQAEQEGLLEFVPDPLNDSYRFRAEVRQDLSEGIFGFAGLYFAHTRFDPATGCGHSFCRLYFNDLGDEARVFPNHKLAGNSLRLYRNALLEPIMRGSACGMTPYYYFTPCGPSGKTAWRRLEIVVRQGALAISWEGQLIRHLSRANVQSCRLPQDQNYDFAALQFEPRGGLGLYLNQSTASIRNAFLEPVVEH